MRFYGHGRVNGRKREDKKCGPDRVVDGGSRVGDEKTSETAEWQLGHSRSSSKKKGNMS